MNQIELLAPAGDEECLRSALDYGCDAVYLAGKSFGMRAGAKNFDMDGLDRAVRLAHERGVKVHLTCNTIPLNSEIEQFPKYIAAAQECGVDAAIACDLGVISMIKEYAPKMELHISTQTGVVNYQTAIELYKMGAKRVVLAREVGLEDIREIHRRIPADMEIETFVHGAMCVSFSGRCLISEYLTGRGANRGECAQPCRWSYYLMEEKRPNQFFKVFEDERGSYILNSRDMCMIDHLPDLIRAGVDSIKIEGRAKSAYYAAIVTGAYRHCIDAVQAGKPLDPIWRNEVEKVSHRHYSTGFFYGQPGQFTSDARYIRDWQVVAVVESCTETGLATASLRNKFSMGDEIELVGPDTRPVAFQAPLMMDENGYPLPAPRHPQMKFQIQLPCYAPPLSFLRACRENS